MNEEKWTIEKEMAALLEQMKKTSGDTKEYQEMVKAYTALEAAKLNRDKFEDEQLRKDDQMDFEERKSRREHEAQMAKLKNEKRNSFMPVIKGGLICGASLVSLYFVLHYEEEGSIGTKALQFLLKPWQNIF